MFGRKRSEPGLPSLARRQELATLDQAQPQFGKLSDDAIRCLKEHLQGLELRGLTTVQGVLPGLDFSLNHAVNIGELRERIENSKHPGGRSPFPEFIDILKGQNIRRPPTKTE